MLRVASRAGGLRYAQIPGDWQRILGKARKAGAQFGEALLGRFRIALVLLRTRTSVLRVLPDVCDPLPRFRQCALKDDCSTAAEATRFPMAGKGSQTFAPLRRPCPRQNALKACPRAARSGSLSPDKHGATAASPSCTASASRSRSGHPCERGFGDEFVVCLGACTVNPRPRIGSNDGTR